MADEQKDRPIEELAPPVEELTAAQAEQAQGGIVVTKTFDTSDTALPLIPAGPLRK